MSTVTKDAYWFHHDSNARQDLKIEAMVLRYGIAGYGMFWVVVEALRESTDYTLRLKSYIWSALAARMLSTPEQAEEFVRTCIDEFELFEADGDTFWSPSLMRRMERWEESKRKKREAGRKGGNAKAQRSSATAKPEQSQSKPWQNVARRGEERRVEESRREENNTPAADDAGGRTDANDSVQSDPGTTDLVPAKHSRKPKSSGLDDFGKRIDAAFLSKHEYANWGKERAHVKKIASLCRNRSPDDPEGYCSGMLNTFWRLIRHERKFWPDQPFTPSALVSLWDRVEAQQDKNNIDEEVMALV